MNVNIKISLTDDQRNLLKRKLTGKDVKAMVSRKEVNELVDGFIESLLEEAAPATAAQVASAPSSVMQFDPTLVPEKYRDMPLAWQRGWFRGRYINKPFRV